MSSTSTSNKRKDAPVDDFAERNSVFVRNFKKTNGTNLVQTKLPTPVERQDEWAISEGNSLSDARQWRSLCERAKFTTAADKECLELLLGTLDIADHIGVHPIELIGFTRRTFPWGGVWTMAMLQQVKDNLVSTDSEDDDTVEVNLGDDPRQIVTSAEADEIDGTVQPGMMTATQALLDN